MVPARVSRIIYNYLSIYLDEYYEYLEWKEWYQLECPEFPWPGCQICQKLYENEETQKVSLNLKIALQMWSYFHQIEELISNIYS